LAYQEEVDNRAEIILRPYPDVLSHQRQVSLVGGTQPVWSHDGKELFYKGPSHLMVFGFNSESGLVTGTAKKLFDYTQYRNTLNVDYQVSLDGERFLMTKLENKVHNEQLFVVMNWVEVLTHESP
jgi:hypothetical protein